MKISVIGVIKSHLDNEEIAPSGIKCKLNVEGIMKTPVTMLNEEFVKWVYENQDKEFTLSRENVKNSLVALAEDCAEAENKKLFDLFTELLIFDEENQERLNMDQKILTVEDVGKK